MIKTIYNTDDNIPASEWVRQEIKDRKDTEIKPHLSSALIVSDKDNQKLVKNSMGSICVLSNSVYKNSKGVSLLSSIQTQGNANISISIISSNFVKATTLFTARKCIKDNWINCKDEYLKPKENNMTTKWKQFEYDSIVYSLFNTASQQSSLRQIDYKGKKWDIKNEFFWLSKNEIAKLAYDNDYDALCSDAAASKERFVYNKLYRELIYDKLSQDARQVLDTATRLLRISIKERKQMSIAHPEYHLDSFDAGYAQLKLVWKEHFKEEFDAFRKLYKDFEDRLRPLVYELGFLKGAQS